MLPLLDQTAQGLPLLQLWLHRPTWSPAPVGTLTSVGESISDQNRTWLAFRRRSARPPPARAPGGLKPSLSAFRNAKIFVGGSRLFACDPNVGLGTEMPHGCLQTRSPVGLGCLWFRRCLGLRGWTLHSRPSAPHPQTLTLTVQ